MTKATKRAVPHDAYPLRTVTAMTGLSPDLIRAWEKRYDVVAPIRGARGARLYSAADIAHLRLLARVVGAGRAIGDVAGLSRSQLERLDGPTVAEEPAGREPRDGFVGRLIERLERFDHTGLARLLGDAVTGMGTRAFVFEVAVPLLQEVGERWRSDALAIADEHLLSGVVRNLVASLIQSRLGSGGPTAVLATPTGERHELGLLLIALLALDAGVSVAYLGVDLPAAEIVAAVRRSDAVLLGISAVWSDNRTSAAQEVQAIQRGVPGQVEIWLGGLDAGAVGARIPSFRGLVIDSLPTAESELARIGGVARWNANRAAMRRVSTTSDGGSRT
jgi:MerR family transcriptional regulator, light-induced transcriptional regulator